MRAGLEQEPPCVESAAAPLRPLQVWAAYSPVKNSPADARAKGAAGDPSHSAASGELDIFKANCQVGGGWAVSPMKVPQGSVGGAGHLQSQLPGGGMGAGAT